MSFYITLPSNASTDTYPSNTPSGYTTKLSQPIQLDGSDWEVGLAEIHVPHTWNNIAETHSVFEYVHDIERPQYSAADFQTLISKLINDDPYYPVYLHPPKISMDTFELYIVPLVQHLDLMDIVNYTTMVMTNLNQVITDLKMEKLTPMQNITLVLVREIMQTVLDLLKGKKAMRTPILDRIKTYLTRCIANVNTHNHGVDTVHYKHRSIKFAHGHYNNVESLMTAMNNALSEIIKQPQIKWHYQPSLRRVRIKAYTENVFIRIPKQAKPLADMLGIADTDEWLPKNGLMIYEGTYMPDLSNGLNTIYAYSDIVKHQFVGSTQVPLLSIIPVDKDDGELIHHRFQMPHYVPISRTCFETIDIHLTTDYGEKIVFEAGKVVCKLHFRRSTP